jgi:ribosomal protein L21E
MFGRLLPTFQQATNNLRQLHHVSPELRNLSASAKARSAQIKTPVGSTRYSSPTLVSSLTKHALYRRVHISVEYTDEALRIARRLSGKVGVVRSHKRQSFRVVRFPNILRICVSTVLHSLINHRYTALFEMAITLAGTHRLRLKAGASFSHICVITPQTTPCMATLGLH